MLHEKQSMKTQKIFKKSSKMNTRYTRNGENFYLNFNLKKLRNNHDLVGAL